MKHVLCVIKLDFVLIVKIIENVFYIIEHLSYFRISAWPLLWISALQ